MRIITIFLICIILSCSNKKVNDNTMLLNEETQNISKDLTKLEAYLDSVQWRKHPDRLLYLMNIEPQKFRSRLGFSNFLGCGDLLTVDDLDRLFGAPNNDYDIGGGLATSTRSYFCVKSFNGSDLLFEGDSLGIFFTYNNLSRDSISVSHIVAIWENEE